jgi:hypothetical protein
MSKRFERMAASDYRLHLSGALTIPVQHEALMRRLYQDTGSDTAAILSLLEREIEGDIQTLTEPELCHVAERLACELAGLRRLRAMLEGPAAADATEPTLWPSYLVLAVGIGLVAGTMWLGDWTVHALALTFWQAAWASTATGLLALSGLFTLAAGCRLHEAALEGNDDDHH